MRSGPSVVAVTIAAVIAGYQEFRGFFRLRSWLGGWVVRLYFQIVFFTIVGRYVGTPGLVQYLLIGNVFAIIALQGTVFSRYILQEQVGGLMGLQLCTPGNYVVSLLSRNVTRIPVCLASAIMLLGAAVTTIQMPLPWPGTLILLPILIIVSFSCYCYGCFIAALVYRFPFLQQAATNVAYLTVTVFAGVNVPISFWPAPVQVGANLMPVSHGLRAARAILGQVPSAMPGIQIALEVLVGIGWVALAGVLLRRWIDADRASGRLDIG